MNRHVRRRLIEAAKAGRTITYAELMREFHIPRGHPTPGIGIGHVVGKISEHERDNGRPLLSAIVVRAHSQTRRCPQGHPGGGFFGIQNLPPEIKRPLEELANPKLSDREQQFILDQQERVWQHWQTHDDPEQDL